MKILITGAAGFIGSQLAYRLWKDKQDLILIDNFSFGHEDNLIFPEHDFREDIIKMDIRNKEGIKSIFMGNEIDYVYNIAGIAPLPDCQLNPQEAVDVNLTGFINILENARLYGVKNIIQASTNAIYENETVFPTYEDNFELPTLIYPNTKYAAERFAESYCKTYKMNIVCLRFANVYGPHIDCLRKQPPFVAYMIRELFYNRTPIFHSNGEQKRDYIYIDDLIKRPELDYEMIKDLDTTREPLDREIKMQVQTMIKYEGYIEKQSQQIEAFFVKYFSCQTYIIAHFRKS